MQRRSCDSELRLHPLSDSAAPSQVWSAVTDQIFMTETQTLSNSEVIKQRLQSYGLFVYEGSSDPNSSCLLSNHHLFHLDFILMWRQIKLISVSELLIIRFLSGVWCVAMETGCSLLSVNDKHMWQQEMTWVNQFHLNTTGSKAEISAIKAWCWFTTRVTFISSSGPF